MSANKSTATIATPCVFDVYYLKMFNIVHRFFFFLVGNGVDKTMFQKRIVRSCGCETIDEKLPIQRKN